MEFRIIILFIAVLISRCGSDSRLGLKSRKVDTLPANTKGNIAMKSMDQNEKLIGVWTDRTTENASIEIGRDSIFYTDRLVSYPYSTDSNKILIKYEDFVYKGIISWKQDTLVFTDQDGVAAKYARFKD